MPEILESGGYFSRNYLRPARLSEDNARMRLRTAAYLSDYFSNESGAIGHYIEKELGIKITSQGAMVSYVNWEYFLQRCSIPDFLDVLTACHKFKPTSQRETRRGRETYELKTFLSRVFRELNLAYRIDENGGIHPFIDLAFSSELSEVIGHLADQNLLAAKQSVENAEMALLGANYDGRIAVRSIFDAVENLFKQICPRSNQLNKSNINEFLRPILLKSMADSPHEQRASCKLVDGMIDWTEAGHNFRHDPGNIQHNAPSALFATTYVSQGFSYIRWLADVFMQRAQVSE